MLVSLAQAKARLRIDDDADDVNVELLIAGASLACLRYMGDVALYNDSAGEIPTDTAGDPIGIPEDVQIAVIYLVGIWYRDPDGVESDKWEHGFLPTPVISILYPFRLPTLA